MKTYEHLLDFRLSYSWLKKEFANYPIYYIGEKVPLYEPLDDWVPWCEKVTDSKIDVSPGSHSWWLLQLTSPLYAHMFAMKGYYNLIDVVSDSLSPDSELKKLCDGKTYIPAIAPLERETYYSVVPLLKIMPDSERTIVFLRKDPKTGTYTEVQYPGEKTYLQSYVKAMSLWQKMREKEIESIKNSNVYQNIPPILANFMEILLRKDSMITYSDISDMQKTGRVLSDKACLLLNHEQVYVQTPSFSYIVEGAVSTGVKYFIAGAFKHLGMINYKIDDILDFMEITSNDNVFVSGKFKFEVKKPDLFHVSINNTPAAIIRIDDKHVVTLTKPNKSVISSVYPKNLLTLYQNNRAIPVLLWAKMLYDDDKLKV